MSSILSVGCHKFSTPRYSFARCSICQSGPYWSLFGLKLTSKSLPFVVPGHWSTYYINSNPTGPPIGCID